MRILVLMTFFLSAFYYFAPREEVGPQIDMLKVKSSAPKRAMLKDVPRTRKIAREAPELETDFEEELVEAPRKAMVRDESDVEHYAEVPENDLETGWNVKLRDMLLYFEPEYGEEIYNGYMDERQAFQNELDELVRTQQRSQDLEFMLDELEIKHEERLKGIFGRYYEEIKYEQQVFLESHAHFNQN